MGAALEIRNLHANVEDKPILRGVNLTIKQGEVHALMGPNGSGKSTLANVLLGHPAYEVTEGEVIFDGKNLLELEADERSRAGLFLAFQYPVSIPGVTLANFLRQAINSRMKAEDPDSKGISIPDFRRLLRSKMDYLQMDHSFAGRYLNEGFSGGEKKRVALARSLAPEPALLLLDEPLTGLDRELHDRLIVELHDVLRTTATTAVLVSHDADEAAALASRILYWSDLQPV